MKNLITVLGLIGIAALGLAAINMDPAFAAWGQGGAQAGIEAAHGDGQPTNLLDGNGGGFVGNVVNFMLYVVGVLSVIMLIWGGLRYVLSGGNEKSVTAAKNTILYAIIGLIVALLSYAIINFVLTSVSGMGGSGGTNV